MLLPELIIVTPLAVIGHPCFEQQKAGLALNPKVKWLLNNAGSESLQKQYK
ncbi:hypothetical protein [Paenibacillus apiarius]|uniref:hypothetical protein n=1 Tax=Paenibacillus apiarius TaxID=46240 RepID=UPI00197F37FB|nr:hypothetical protein [Paenibacillus apiarius]MBN3526751.1 hypothetical protein [Paenibacillus apiarius]